MKTVFWFVYLTILSIVIWTMPPFTINDWQFIIIGFSLAIFGSFMVALPLTEIIVGIYKRIKKIH